jgi:hypothetical protein
MIISTFFLLLLVVFCGVMMEESEAARAANVLLLEGVQLPLEKMLEHHHDVCETDNDTCRPPPSAPVLLRFNGAGVRSISFFGWDFKVYVAGFYIASGTPPLENPQDVLLLSSDNDAPIMQLDFTFLRSVNQDKVTQAWKEQLAHSVDANAALYNGYERDRDTFVGCFGPIQNGGTESVVLLGDGRTIIVDQGVKKGVIEGKNFQKAFLSMWFGENAVAADLKAGLLGKIGHFGLHMERQHDEIDVVVVGTSS